MEDFFFDALWWIQRKCKEQIRLFYPIFSSYESIYVVSLFNKLLQNAWSGACSNPLIFPNYTCDNILANQCKPISIIKDFCFGCIFIGNPFIRSEFILRVVNSNESERKVEKFGDAVMYLFIIEMLIILFLCVFDSAKSIYEFFLGRSTIKKETQVVLEMKSHPI